MCKKALGESARHGTKGLGLFYVGIHTPTLEVGDKWSLSNWTPCPSVSGPAGHPRRERREAHRGCSETGRSAANTDVFCMCSACAYHLKAKEQPKRAMTKS